MKEYLLHEYNPWWEASYRFEYQIREKIETKLQKMLFTKDLIFLTGLRRVGKTTIMKALISHLISSNYPPKQIMYISLDDYMLNNESLEEIIQLHKKIHKQSSDMDLIIFLDEITYLKDFHLQLKNIYDKQKAKIFASSSSSSSLKDRQGFLTGRKRIFEITPLDFPEYLAFKNIQLKKSDHALLNAHFEDFLHTGGMPESVITNDRAYLTALVDDILNKDIIAYHGIKNTHSIRELFKLLMERCGKQVSINKVANILKISPDTSKRYITMFQDCYLIHMVNRYGKINDHILSPNKIYASDLGIRHLVTGTRDLGAAFENYVFLKIKHLDPKYYYNNKVELDFITNNNVVIEVKYNQFLKGKQLEAFENIEFSNKLLIGSVDDLAKLDSIDNHS